jgi:signal transduction histidine kinase
LLLAGIHGAVLAVTLLNVLAAALLMFLSPHDLLLLLLTLGFATVLSLLFGYAVSGALVADLDRVSRAARRLAAGDLSTRAALDGKGEVAQLGMAFDQMAGQLQASIERERAQELARREMVAAVSHDLRTPLTTVRAMVEAVTDGVVSDPAEVRRYLELIRGEVRHLSRLIDDLFELSQIESGALRLELAPTDLPELVMQTLEAYEAPARDGGVTLEHEADPSIPAVRADAARLMRVLRNLIDNALRYTPSGGKVQVAARVERAERPAVRVAVRDTGPGLPPGESERIFERFYRGARARTRGEKQSGPAAASPIGTPTGAGLGLTIARGLVQAHGGRLWAENHPDGGAIFQFTLPLTSTA